jgi:hypothetical protein
MEKEEMSISYLSMTKQVCLGLGRCFWKTEQWNSYAHIRQDLFGFADAISLGISYIGIQQGIETENRIIAIQCTGPSGYAEHRKKIIDNVYAKRWLECGGLIELWGWRQLVDKGKSKSGKRRKTKHWWPRIELITLADFNCEP